uniref:Uncharacterized protein n=1 Tax=Ditylenchus dipsaci TaxID=166011 RepID=A0A915E3H0_9BILA
MTFSIKRKWFELKRLLRHQTVIFLIFAISLIGFVFFISSIYSSGSGQEEASLVYKRVLVTLKTCLISVQRILCLLLVKMENLSRWISIRHRFVEQIPNTASTHWRVIWLL